MTLGPAGATISTMSYTFVVRPAEHESFVRCRRQWDFSAWVRQNYVPATPPRVFDFDKAIHDALAVYYFPAMDDWNRAIVRPLALQGFRRSMEQDRALYERFAPLTPEQEARWEEHVEVGQGLLTRYLAWAATVDMFDSIFADEEFWAPIPDPENPGAAMATPDGRIIRYMGRIDQLISNQDNEDWVVDHRVVRGDWAQPHELLLDPVGLANVWGFGDAYLQLHISGTIYNELLLDPGRGTGPSAEELEAIEERDRRDMTGVRRVSIRGTPLTPEEKAGIVVADETAIVHQEGNDEFRRTYVRRSRASIEAIAAQLGEQTLLMRDPDIPIYAHPSELNCPRCQYLGPCLATNQGDDVDQILATEYRRRDEEEFEEERLRWSAARKGRRAAYGGEFKH